MQFNSLNETTDAGWIETAKLGSGWAAVHMVNVTRDDKSTYVDVMNTGMGRYASEIEARFEAREWADAESLEFRTKPE